MYQDSWCCRCSNVSCVRRHCCERFTFDSQEESFAQICDVKFGYKWFLGTWQEPINNPVEMEDVCCEIKEEESFVEEKSNTANDSNTTETIEEQEDISTLQKQQDKRSRNRSKKKQKNINKQNKRKVRSSEI